MKNSYDVKNLRITGFLIFLIGFMILVNTVVMMNKLHYMLIILKLFIGILYIFVSITIWFEERKTYLYRFVLLGLLVFSEVGFYVVKQTDSFTKLMPHIFNIKLGDLYSILIAMFLFYLSVIYDFPRMFRRMRMRRGQSPNRDRA